MHPTVSIISLTYCTAAGKSLMADVHLSSVDTLYPHCKYLKRTFGQLPFSFVF